MYSVVLMMALSGGAGAPALNDVQAEPVAKYGDHGHKEYRLFGRRRGCHGGGGGCYGGGGGCHGGGYGGCYGGGYGGCTGGGGGCWGGGYGGCSGGGYGGCSGGGYYGSLSGGYYGSLSGGYYGAMPYEGGYGYYSYSMPMSSYSGIAPITGGYQYGTPEGSYYDSNSSAPATIVVSVPADAKLTFDGTATQSTDSVRTFTSPPLQPGKEYQYTLRAEVTRDGKKVERTREVNVRAGQTSQVNIDFAEQLPTPNTKNK